MNHTVVVLVGGVHRGVLEALAYARSLSPDHLVAVTVVSDDEEQERHRDAVGRSTASTSRSRSSTRPYRELTRADPALHRRARRPLGERRHHRAHPRVLGDALVGHLLHNQSALLLKGRLLFRKGTVVTSVPYHLE